MNYSELYHEQRSAVETEFYYINAKIILAEYLESLDLMEHVIYAIITYHDLKRLTKENGFTKPQIKKITKLSEDVQGLENSNFRR